ncbi:MAG: phage holin family protein [Muribaculaceae bacterium]|nr:phage holin family protein [Muribaculaceae bacterium]
MNNTSEPNTLSGIAATVSAYVKLLVEDTRLNVAEKITRLLSAIALAALLVIIATVAMVFVTIAVALALSQAISPLWSFIIVAAFYIVLLAVLVLCRRACIVNPIARFISSLLLNPPVTDNKNDTTTPVS